MPELPVFGQIDKPEELDLDPIVVPLAGYKTVRGKVVEEIGRFPFKPMMAAGVRALMENMAGPDGEIPYAIVLTILNQCVEPDARERWGEFLDRGDLSIEREALGAILNGLVEHYSQRPTRRPSVSSGTGRRRARTSTAGPPSTE